MNRAARRQLERRMKGVKTKAMNVPGSVTLRGGPMDGWVVKPDAPALQPDWRTKFLEEAARDAYEKTLAETKARWGAEAEQLPAWQDLDDAARERYRSIVHEAHGDGRYVMATGTQLPEARWEPR